MGNAACPPAAAAFSQIILAGILGERAGETDFFMRILLSAPEYGSFDSNCIACDIIFASVGNH
jgi:hypothetical protein